MGALARERPVDGTFPILWPRMRPDTSGPLDGRGRPFLHVFPDGCPHICTYWVRQQVPPLRRRVRFGFGRNDNPFCFVYEKVFCFALNFRTWQVKPRESQAETRFGKTRLRKFGMGSAD